MSSSPGDTWKQEKALEACVGGTVTIRLWEDRTRGEIYAPLYDSSAFALIGDEYDRMVGENWNIVDSGKRVFEFRPLKAGVHRLVLEKRMGWRFTAEDRRVYVVTVGAGATAS
jgi:chagasin family peptidase inhibitor I42